MASIRGPCQSRAVRSKLGRVAVCVSLVACLIGCAGGRAYLDWRPGLTASDFDGLFEIPADEYREHAERGAPNTLIDRAAGIQRPDTVEALAEIGGRLAGAAADPDGGGWAIVGLIDSAGGYDVDLMGGNGPVTGPLDWLATTADRHWVAVVSGSRLAVAIGPASTGIDVGGLLGPRASGFALTMVVEDQELTVFAIPELGGAIAANEPGYVFSFSHQVGRKQAWEVSVARVTVAM